jgi:transposase
MIQPSLARGGIAVFLRRFQRRKNGKVHAYFALVESYRTAKGSRQRIVSYLGELEAGEENGWAKLGRGLDGKPPPSPTLFDVEPVEAGDDETVCVELRGIRLERVRSFGDVWLALGLWRLLELDGLLTKLLPEGREEVPWASVAAILAIARFCQPRSELYIETTWYRDTALDDLLAVPSAKVHTDRLYAGMDQVLPHKEAIEKHLRGRVGELFTPSQELLIYDVTSTYFEGQCADNPQAKRGHSRDHRPDCLQVCIGLVVTEEGLPLGYEVFPGNRHDSTTLKTIVDAMERKYGRSQRIWVLDRGMVSEDNLQMLRERGGRYIVGTPKATLRRFEQQLLEQDWTEVQPGVDVKRVAADSAQEIFVLARSRDRRAKEQAMHAKFVARVEEGLQALQKSIASGRLKKEADAQRRLGRLLQKNSRAAKAFQVTIETLAAPEGKAHLRITWQKDADWARYADLSEGCYLLRTNVIEMEPAALWKQYIQLTEAEWAFRISKDELRLRPVWHQKEHRVQSHILVCFLAYVMWKTLAQWMRHSGLGDAPRSLLDELAKIRSGDVVLPTRSAAGAPARDVRLRCVTEPDAAQKMLLARLGLRLPRRLRQHTPPAEM